MMELNSMSAIRIAASKAGNHWFDRDTLRFFNSRISGTVYPSKDGSCYFVSSERMDWQSPRLYSVRRAFYDADGGFRIETVEEFQHYASRSGAHKAAQRTAKA